MASPRNIVVERRTRRRVLRTVRKLWTGVTTQTDPIAPVGQHRTLLARRLWALGRRNEEMRPRLPYEFELRAIGYDSQRQIRSMLNRHRCAVQFRLRGSKITLDVGGDTWNEVSRALGRLGVRA